MSEESIPVTPDQPADAAAPTDVENLADSEDAAVLSARAQLLTAQAALTKASTPLWDKIIIRGILPLALAVVGPWALLKFDASQVEQVKQGKELTELRDTTTDLKALLKAAKEEAAARQKRSVEWKERMKQIDDAKAVELTAMVSMVGRLDDMLKVALIQQAVARLVATVEPDAEKPSDPKFRPEPTPEPTPSSDPVPLLPRPVRDRVLEDVAEQVQLPGLSPDEVKRIAGEQYDRLMRQKARK